MNSLRYTPGDWCALVNAEHAVLLPADTSSAQVMAFWNKLQEAATVESLLSELLSLYQMNIAALPDFALVSRTTAPHTVVRGSLELRSKSNSSDELVSGVGIATWAERQLAESQGWTLGPVEATPGDAAALPIQEGIVRVSHLSWNQDNTPTTDVEEAVKQEPQATASKSVPAMPSSAPTPPAANEPGVAEAPKPQPPVVEDAADASAVAEKPAPAPAKPENEEEAPKPQLPVAKEAADKQPSLGQIPKPQQPESQDADNDDTFIPSSERDYPDDDVNGQTQDPEDYEHHLHSAEFSLASQLLGIRGALDTKYDTGEGDDLDTIIKSRAAASSAQPADEHTIIRGIKGMNQVPPPRPEPDAGDESHSGPTEYILARSCEQHHPNPPTSSTCHLCGATLSGPARQVRKPAMGRMMVRDRGGIRQYSHELNRSVVLGRQPSVSAVNEPNPPRLLQIDSPSGDISRSHLLVRLEGWHVQLVDLGATNGTMLLREGQAPRRLSKNQEVMLINGDVADLGDGVSLRFEDLP
ncbi:FHA domain-containing protein [Glutamicibacter sp. JL.03c]|uniref:FHA domain-containing protein n=1 Tax=Glutamicibacter sp. JL.03c TaxID=2984842 RepID=UPI0021F7AF7B|nr:FHA domain-containing protein [Glutamicibacter sp. JL.03c]UYQ78340.1 FHA domain-containing protein [Glutamicibacter sp. JL.03c]